MNLEIKSSVNFKPIFDISRNSTLCQGQLLLPRIIKVKSTLFAIGGKVSSLAVFVRGASPNFYILVSTCRTFKSVDRRTGDVHTFEVTAQQLSKNRLVLTVISAAWGSSAQTGRQQVQIAARKRQSHPRSKSTIVN